MNAPLKQALTIRRPDLRDPGQKARIESFLCEMDATPFHRPAWLVAVERGAGQRACGLLAERNGLPVGWLPLVAVDSPFFPRTLVSSAFGVRGGPLAPREEDALTLCRAAEELAQRMGAVSVETRERRRARRLAADRGQTCQFRR